MALKESKTDILGMATVPLSVQFGLRVRELRLASGLSQEAFANKHGFARSYLSKIERGKSNLALDAIVRLADALGVEVIALFDFSAKSVPEEPASAKVRIKVPYSADGACFHPDLRQPRAGTYAVGNKKNRRTFADFGEALAYLKPMKPAQWRRPPAKGKAGLVTAVKWDWLVLEELPP